MVDAGRVTDIDDVRHLREVYVVVALMNMMRSARLA